MLCGGLFGGFLFGILHPWTGKYLSAVHYAEFLDEMTNIPYHKLALIAGFSFFTLAFILEIVFPWNGHDMYVSNGDCALFDCRSWVPTVEYPLSLFNLRGNAHKKCLFFAYIVLRGGNRITPNSLFTCLWEHSRDGFFLCLFSCPMVTLFSSRKKKILGTF